MTVKELIELLEMFAPNATVVMQLYDNDYPWAYVEAVNLDSDGDVELS